MCPLYLKSVVEYGVVGTHVVRPDSAGTGEVGSARGAWRWVRAIRESPAGRRRTYQ